MADVVGDKLIQFRVIQPQFLTSQENFFDAGYEYKTINSHRSAISAYHQTIDSKGVGSNDKACKL